MFELIQFLTQPSWLKDAFAGLLGLCVGSFLNVVAVRSLEEKNWLWPPSACPKCQHRLGILDLVPVISYWLLQGRCRYCQAPISWQYPVVEAVTAVTFVAVVHVFATAAPNSPPPEILLLRCFGMLYFACTLIAVTVTDFKEKLIPHEITYPAILLGLFYTATVQGAISPDPTIFISALAGVGISYILFDFLAFYGLKLYLLTNKGKDEDKEGDSELEQEADAEIDGTFNIAPEKTDEEEFEVMGGGDAVLSAVIAAWLGLQRLGTALVVGFLVGTFMGGVYLIIELYRRKLLKECVRPAAKYGLMLAIFVEAMLFAFWRMAPSTPVAQMPWIGMGLIGAFCGALLGVISVGRRISKPFPFGPALAIGAGVAMFYNPLGNG